MLFLIFILTLNLIFYISAHVTSFTALVVINRFIRAIRYVWTSSWTHSER